MNAKDKERKAIIDEALAAGWKWSNSEPNVLHDPQDEARYYWVDPHTREALLSPALIEALRQMIEERKA